MIRNVAVPERRIQRDTCKQCLNELRFDTGEFGQSLQACGCSGWRFVPIVVDTTAPPPPMSAAERQEIKRALKSTGRGRGNPNFGRKS